jgi:cell filamentation protein, protein adenylyltransferase
MAIIHYQFESIHPFYDGNGRTGRIINILYMVQKKLLNIPVLYLSRFIIENKIEYYRLLQGVRDTGNWEEWILYILDGVESTAQQTIYLIQEIRRLMMEYKHQIRKQFKFYSQDLLNNIFSYPYTKIDFIVNDLDVTRKTAAKYLDELSKGGFLRKEKIGTGHFYVNEPLFALFTQKRE